MELHVVKTDQGLGLSYRIHSVIGREFEAATTAIVRKVSNQRVWGLGRLTNFCNPEIKSALK